MRRSLCAWLYSCLARDLPLGLLGSWLNCTGMHSVTTLLRYFIYRICEQSSAWTARQVTDSRCCCHYGAQRDANAAVSMVRSQTGVLTHDRLRLGQRWLLLGSWCHRRRLGPQACTSTCLLGGRQSVCLLRLLRRSLNCLRLLLLLLVCSGLRRQLLLLLLLLRRSLLLRLWHLSWRAHAGRRCDSLVGNKFSQDGATGLHVAGSRGLSWLLRLRLAEGRLRLLEHGNLQQAGWHCEGQSSR